VSSSGHLVIFFTLFGEPEESNLAFTVFLHLATLMAVIIVFYKDVWILVREFFTSITDIVRGKPDFKAPERRFLLLVIVGTIPVAIAGVSIKMLEVEKGLENIFVVAVMLLVTAALMFVVDRFKDGKYTEADTPIKSAVIVGMMQALALLPGLSRSGSTIFGGLLGGMTKEFAVRFAFILSIPAVIGAGMVELLDVIKMGNVEINTLSWMVGFVATLISGILAIRVIKALIRSNRFYLFGVYCLCAAAVAFLIGFGVIGVN